MTDDKKKHKLADAITAFISLRKDKKEEAFLKEKPKKNKQGIVTNGAINIRLLEVVKRLYEDDTDLEKIEKSKKAKEQTSLVFQQDKYRKLLTLLKAETENASLLDLKDEYQQFMLSNAQEHETVTWLNQWTKKAKDISFATHVGKLTHSSSKGSSILDVSTQTNNKYLTTNSLKNTEVDTASSNAASLPIAEVLKLEVNGISLLDCLKVDDTAFFKQFTNDEELIRKWCDQLKQAYDSSQKQSYFLSKQIYFPTDSGQYHLLLPLTSSSLVHAIHLKHKLFFDDPQKEAREQKKGKKYSAITTCSYPNKAYLHVTGSNHSNASSLNGKRGGRIALLPTMPPQWGSNLTSYLNKSSIFDKTLSFRLSVEITELQKYLLLIKNKSLSISEPKRNAVVISKLNAITSQFFDYAELINAQEAKVNWTCDSKLPIEEQLLFEPWRADEVAKAVKLDNQWQKTISKTYGRWLNKQLAKKKKLVLTPIHSALWAGAFLLELHKTVAIQEVTL